LELFDKKTYHLIRYEEIFRTESLFHFKESPKPCFASDEQPPPPPMTVLTLILLHFKSKQSYLSAITPTHIPMVVIGVNGTKWSGKCPALIPFSLQNSTNIQIHYARILFSPFVRAKSLAYHGLHPHPPRLPAKSSS
jgi:hypothetical protein